MMQPLPQLPDLTDPDEATDEEETRILPPDPDLLSYARATATPLPPTVRPPRMVN
jgi:hypothetical protein